MSKQDGGAATGWRESPDWTLCPQCGGTGLYTAFSRTGGAMPDTDCEICGDKHRQSALSDRTQEAQS